MKVLKIKTAWPERSGFSLERTNENECVFIHMSSRAILNENGVRRACNPGACIFYPPYSFQILEAFSEGLIHDWMHLSPESISLFEKYRICPETLYDTPDDGFITTAMRELELESMNRREHCDEMCELKLREIMIYLSRTSNTDFARSVSPNIHAAFSELREEIHLDYQKKWSVNEMAERVHLSPSRFYAVYKSIFGQSPKSDLLTTRLEHAKRFLSDNTCTVSAVAEMTGYDNVYHFIRAFKGFCGMTPSEYRASHSQKQSR